jgi:glycosyltransferase involved in cell wall biosynthesis
LIRSLSVLLPVYNAQPHLESLVEPLLEIVPELTADFEVLLIDNGSTDETIEVARHLAAKYPQLFLTRHERRLDRELVLEAACAMARGDVLFAREEQANLDLRNIDKLWRQMARRDFVCALGTRSSASVEALWSTANRANGPARDDAASPRFGTVSEALSRSPPPAFYMFKRALAADLPWSLRDADATVAEMTSRGYDCEKIIIRSAAMVSSAAPAPMEPMPEIVTSKPARPRRPNYLARILAITAGN